MNRNVQMIIFLTYKIDTISLKEFKKAVYNNNIWILLFAFISLNAAFDSFPEMEFLLSSSFLSFVVFLLLEWTFHIEASA